MYSKGILGTVKGGLTLAVIPRADKIETLCMRLTVLQLVDRGRVQKNLTSVVIVDFEQRIFPVTSEGIRT